MMTKRVVNTSSRSVVTVQRPYLIVPARLLDLGLEAGPPRS